MHSYFNRVLSLSTECDTLKMCMYESKKIYIIQIDIKISISVWYKNIDTWKYSAHQFQALEGPGVVLTVNPHFQRVDQKTTHENLQ